VLTSLGFASLRAPAPRALADAPSGRFASEAARIGLRPIGLLSCSTS